jgi:hypothetical protein
MNIKGQEKLIETVGNIEYWQCIDGYQARFAGIVISNPDLDRLKRDAGPCIDLINNMVIEASE